MNFFRLNLLSGVIAATLMTSATVSALPVTITEASAPVVLNFNGFYNSSMIVIPGLAGRVTLSNFDFNSTTLSGNPATTVTFNYSISNTSQSPVLTSRISNFAFDTTPTILASAPNSITGVFDTVRVNANQPNGIGTVETCFTDANCPGGGSGGVTIGNTGGGTATLYYGGLINSFTIDNAFVRYQSVSCTAGSPCSGSASGTVTGGAAVPEPSSYALMSLGIAGLAFAARYNRKK
jgi:hypothetical protein